MDAEITTSGNRPLTYPQRKRLVAGGKLARRLAKQEQIQQAIALRKAGCGYVQIAKHLGCALSTAHRLVEDGVKLAQSKTGEEARVVKAMIVERMDMMTLKLVTMLDSKKDPPTGEMTLSIIREIGKLDERRARLEGLLDGPTVNTGPVQINVDMRQQIAARMDPILANLSLEQKCEMLRLIELGEKPADRREVVMIEAKVDFDPEG